MRIYHYHSNTGELLGDGLADPSPLDALNLIPAFATELAPPTAGANQVAVFANGAWSIQPDWRGHPLFSITTGQPVDVTAIGPKPDNTTEISQPSLYHRWQNNAWDLDLLAYKSQKIQSLEASRNSSIDESVVSSALGAPHTYAAKTANRRFLNDLVTLNTSGKFTCIDAGGVKARRLHTAVQLKQVATDFQVAIEAKFEHFEALVAAVSAATNQVEIDAINW